MKGGHHQARGGASNRAADFLAGLGTRKSDGSTERRRGISATGSASGRTSRSGDNKFDDRSSSRPGSTAIGSSSRLDTEPRSRSASRAASTTGVGGSLKLDLGPRSRSSSRNSVLDDRSSVISKDSRRHRRRHHKGDDDVDDSAPPSSVPSTPDRATPVTSSSATRDNRRPPLDMKNEPYSYGGASTSGSSGSLPSILSDSTTSCDAPNNIVDLPLDLIRNATENVRREARIDVQGVQAVSRPLEADPIETKGRVNENTCSKADTNMQGVRTLNKGPPNAAQSGIESEMSHQAEVNTDGSESLLSSDSCHDQKETERWAEFEDSSTSSNYHTPSDDASKNLGHKDSSQRSPCQNNSLTDTSEHQISSSDTDTNSPEACNENGRLSSSDSDTVSLGEIRPFGNNSTTAPSIVQSCDEQHTSSSLISASCWEMGDCHLHTMPTILGAGSAAVMASIGETSHHIQPLVSSTGEISIHSNRTVLSIGKGGHQHRNAQPNVDLQVQASALPVDDNQNVYFRPSTPPIVHIRNFHFQPSAPPTDHSQNYVELMLEHIYEEIPEIVSSQFEKDGLLPKEAETDIDNLGKSLSRLSQLQNDYYDIERTTSLAINTVMQLNGRETSPSQSDRRTPDTFLSSRASTPRGSSLEQRSLAVEKEVIESQVRRLQVENSSLQTENKWLKEKYNKSQAKVQDLEIQLEDALSQADESKGDLSRELQKLKRRSRETTERDHEQLSERLLKMSKENDMLKAENGSLEKQLELARSSTDALHNLSFSDRSKILEAYKMEASSLKDELKRVKELLNQCERSLNNETDQRKETAKKLAEVSEFNSVLKQQLDSGSEGSTAEKKVKSLEQRLKITEERLHQERGDRASKLSEVEDKLLNENAKLQVEAKESKRQLNREKDKYKNLDQKFKDLRSKKDATFSSGDGKSIHEYVEEIKILKDTAEDIKSAKELQDSFNKQQIKELTEEKHSYFGKCKTLQDLLDARQAEVDSLRRNLGGGTSGGTSGSASSQTVINLKGQIESLNAEIQSLETKMQQKQRSNKLLETEVESLKSQLDAKQVTIDELNAELEKANQMKGGGANDLKQQKIDRLMAEAREQATELEILRGKQDKWNSEKTELEEQLDDARHESNNSRNKKQRETRTLESYENHKSTLEKELSDKDSLLLERTAQFHDAEDNLQRTRQELVLAQDHIAELESEVENLQLQLSQEAHRNQRLSSTEQDVQQEVDSLRENLRSVNRDLTQKNTELKLLNVEMKREKARVEKLEQDLEKKSQQVEKYQSELLEKDMKTNSLSSQSKQAQGDVADLRRRLTSVETERDNLKTDLSKANNSLDTMVMENSDLLKQVRETKQETSREKVSVAQYKSELKDLEQRHLMITDERDSLKREKTQLEVDLSKREADLKRTITKVEDNAKTQQAKYEDEYKNLSLGGKMLSDELDRTKKLCDVREQEIEMLNDSINRQKQELASQKRKMDSLEEEVENLRNDLDRSNQNLADKMKESEGHSEVSQYLSNEKQQLQLTKYQLEKDLTTERAENDRRDIEMEEMTKKLDKAAEKQRLLEKESSDKDAMIASLHAERRQDNSRIMELDGESYALQQKIEKLNEEITRLGNVNSSLEKRLEMEKESIGEEKTMKTQLREELSVKKKEHEVLRYEFEKLSSNATGDKKSMLTLKEENRQLSDTVDQLENKLRTTELQHESLTVQCKKEAEGRESAMKDKQNLYSDLQELCVKLAQKDDTIAKLQEEADNSLSRARSDFSTEKSSFNKHREDLEMSLRRTKFEVEELNECIKKKDIVIGTLNKTVRELEDEERLRKELEFKIRGLESEVDDAGLQRANLKGETLVLTDTNKQLQENIQKIKSHNTTLKDELKSTRENSNREIRDLKLQLSELTNKAESQERILKDQLGKATSELKATQASMDAHTESKSHLQVTTKSLEKTLDAIKTQLHEEITLRRLAEQKLESLQTSSDQLRKAKIINEDKNEELQNQINKLEPELRAERDRLRKLQSEYDELTNVSTAHEQRAQLLDNHIQELQGEISNLQAALDSQKQHLTGKSKKANLELRQQVSNFETERGKLIIKAQQLTIDLEKAREQLVSKNRENLKLHEEVLVAEERSREMKASLLRSEEGLKSEKDLHNRLAERNSSLESELGRLRNTANRLEGTENNDKVNTLKNEMSKQLQDITLKLQMELNRDKNVDVSKEQLNEYKRKVGELKSALSTEQTLHAVTKSSLKSTDEDNQRLRLQLMMMKRKDSPAPDRSGLSRMDKINEIIAKAQTQAQAMMSTGAYTLPFQDSDVFRTMTPTREFGNTLFRGTAASPDPVSMGSDRSHTPFMTPNRA